MSSMLKLNPEKKQFIIFGFHAQLKKLDSYLPVWIFGKLLHPSTVVKNLVVWFDANVSFGDHVRNICKTCLIQSHRCRICTSRVFLEVGIRLDSPHTETPMTFKKALIGAQFSHHLHTRISALINENVISLYPKTNFQRGVFWFEVGMCSGLFCRFKTNTCREKARLHNLTSMVFQYLQRFLRYQPKKMGVHFWLKSDQK